jgi:hypothetical protein
MPSPAQLQKHLKGVSYPADKDDLIEAAETNDAPDDVIDVLQTLDDDLFDSPAEVSAALSEVLEEWEDDDEDEEE